MRTFSMLVLVGMNSAFSLLIKVLTSVKSNCVQSPCICSEGCSCNTTRLYAAFVENAHSPTNLIIWTISIKERKKFWVDLLHFIFYVVALHEIIWIQMI